MEKMMVTFNMAMKLKAKMIERKLVLAKTNCQHEACKGVFVARLVGKKQHIHGKCTSCGAMIME